MSHVGPQVWFHEMLDFSAYCFGLTEAKLKSLLAAFTAHQLGQKNMLL